MCQCVTNRAFLGNLSVGPGLALGIESLQKGTEVAFIPYFSLTQIEGRSGEISFTNKRKNIFAQGPKLAKLGPKLAILHCFSDFALF